MPPTLQEYTLQEGLPRNGSITSKMNFMTRVRYGLQVSGIGCGINMGTKWRSGRHGMIMMWISKPRCRRISARSEEHTSELQSLLRISYAVFCLKKKKKIKKKYK